MRRTLNLKGCGLLLKQCDSKQQAAQERTATDYARTIGGRVQAPRVHRQFGRVLVLEYVAGPSLEQEPSEDRVRGALEFLSSLHATAIPERAMNHYYGESMRNRLREELRFVEDRRSLLGIDGEPVEVIRQACALPELSLEALRAEPPVLGHGDYQARNILWHCERGIVPIDWLDSGVCDPRYEWAHFLNSFDGRFGSRAVERLVGLANEVLCPNVNRQAFARALRVGEIMDRIIRAGSKARTAEDGADNTDRAAKLRAHIQRLAAIL